MNELIQMLMEWAAWRPKQDKTFWDKIAKLGATCEFVSTVKEKRYMIAI